MGMSRSYKVLQRWLGLHRDLNSLAVANSTRNYHPPPSIKSDFQGLVVDLRSDTLTCPSSGMKEAMMNALLGDDVYREDPTCKEFERRMSEYTGKEAALFVASGTMGNLISVLVHCGSRGSEVLLGDQSHLFLYEQAGMAQLGGVQSHIISNKPDGTFDIADVLSRVRGDDVHCPVTELICIENTHNVCGGKILPRQWIDELGDAVHGLDLPLHMDGARLINAAVASRESPATILNNCDTASICLSKGLGTPVGSVIVGSEEFINKALRLRKALGGGMRQVGMLAAAALYALDHNVDRLADDHKHARLLAQGGCILPLMVIGKAKKPRAFNNIAREDLPVFYRNSKNSWMTAFLFSEWFYESFVPSVTKYLQDENLPMKAHLYVDNCPAHPGNLRHGDIICKFLPPNTTSVLQPMDQGILGQLKNIYKASMMVELISDDDKGILQKFKEYDIMQAITNVANAWKEIKPESHQKSWRKLIPDNEITDFEGFNPKTKESKSSK